MDLVFIMQDSMTVNPAYHLDDPQIGFELSYDRSTYKLYLCDTGLFVTLAFWDKQFRHEPFRSWLFRFADHQFHIEIQYPTDALFRLVRIVDFYRWFCHCGLSGLPSYFRSCLSHDRPSVVLFLPFGHGDWRSAFLHRFLGGNDNFDTTRKTCVFHFGTH